MKKKLLIAAVVIIIVLSWAYSVNMQNTGAGLPPKSGENDSEEFVQKVTEAIDGQVGKGEAILSVELVGDNLIVTVDLSGATVPNGFSINELAESRTCSITDKILKFDEYDDIWETITVDFGDVGYVKCGKDDIEDSSYGRFFSSEAVKLQ